MTVSDQDMVLLFGATPVACETIWQMLQQTGGLHPTAEPIHLLWALYEAKNYPRTREIGIHLGVNEKTFNKHAEPIRKSFLKILPKVVSHQFQIALFNVTVTHNSFSMFLIYFRLNGATEKSMMMAGLVWSTLMAPIVRYGSSATNFLQVNCHMTQNGSRIK